MKKIIIILIIVCLFLLICNMFPVKKGKRYSIFSSNDKKPLIIAHGGAKKLFPENTMVAFDGSMAIGVDVLEMDVRLTKDNILVTHHDETINRTSNGKGEINFFTYDELQKYNFGYHFIDPINKERKYKNIKVIIPKLEEVIKKYSNIPLIIEIKDEGVIGKKSADQLVKMLSQYNSYNRVIVASFHDEIVEYIRNHYPYVAVNGTQSEVKKFVLSSYTLLPFIFQKTPVSFMLPISEYNISLHTKKIIKDAKKRNIVIYYWTIDDPKMMKKLLERGVEGIMTDRPDILKKVISDNSSEKK